MNRAEGNFHAGRAILDSVEAGAESDPRYQIFFQLEKATIEKEPVWPRLLTQVQSGEVKNIVAMGAPGVGKTTWTVQAEMFIRDQMHKTVGTVRYDEVLAFMAGPNGLDKPYIQWDNNDWMAFSERYKGEMLGQMSNEVVIAETVAVGAKDRGRRALIDLTNDQEIGLSTTIVGFIPDRRIFERASRLRNDVKGASPMGVTSILQDYNMRIEDLPRRHTRQERTYVGNKIKEKFERMAPSDRIRAIDNEIALLSARSDIAIIRRINELERTRDAVEDPSKWFSDDVETELRYLNRTRMNHYMFNVGLEFGATPFLTVYNQRSTEEIVWPWSYFESGQSDL
jgi:hypothetical protein